MKYKLYQDGYPFDGRSFDIDNGLRSIKEMSPNEQIDLINVAKEHISQHGAIVQMFIESLDHLWDKEEYDNLLVQLAILWYKGDSIYRKVQHDEISRMLNFQRTQIIKYYSPPHLINDRVDLLQLYISKEEQ